uniref:Uncharacterized protein n=1 Tax=Hyaloperonospora arabidopsidis (strain Emoy2) TaxID=559515 RepID=M4BET6_HYAAE
MRLNSSSSISGEKLSFRSCASENSSLMRPSTNFSMFARVCSASCWRSSWNGVSLRVGEDGFEPGDGVVSGTASGRLTDLRSVA